MFMDATNGLLLPGLIFAAALLYSTVGHAGASGYLASMALCGVAPLVMKPTALSLNILVATITTVQFARAGYLRWRLLWPFVVASVPCAFFGGRIELAPTIYRPIVGVVLLISAVRLFWIARRVDTADLPPPTWVALPVGAILGFVSGLTGVGGGIFLSPLLLFFRWADTRTTAATSAAFILLNSVAGLLGHASVNRSLPPQIPYWAMAAVAGGLIGSWVGSRRAAPSVLRMLLVVVLTIAGGKLLLA
jgi:uncharacterized protein